MASLPLDSLLASLRVNELKKVLDTLNLRKAGNRSDLVDRIKAFFDTHPAEHTRIIQIVQTCLDELRRSRNPFGGYNIPPQTIKLPGPNQNMPPLPPNLYKPTHPTTQITIFEQSPFYTDVKLIAQRISPSGYNQQPILISFSLDLDSQQKLSEINPSTGKSDFKMIAVVGAVATVPNTFVKLEYPQNTSLHLNGQILQISASQKKQNMHIPADLTKHLRLNSPNELRCCFYRLQSRTVVALKVVKETPISDIIKEVATKRTLSKSLVLEKRNIKKEDDDIIAGIEKVSLKDPFSRCRIQTPLRSEHCKHIQCFDGEAFFSMVRRVPTWECPVCFKKIKFENLIVDGYFSDILTNTDADCEYILVEPNGAWVKEKDEDSIMTTKSVSQVGDCIMIDDDDYNPSLKQTPAKKISPKKQQIEVICISSDDDEEVSTSANTQPVLPPTFKDPKSYRPTNQLNLSVLPISHSNPTPIRNNLSSVVPNTHLSSVPNNLSSIVPTTHSSVVSHTHSSELLNRTHSLSDLPLLKAAELYGTRKISVPDSRSPFSSSTAMPLTSIDSPTYLPSSSSNNTPNNFSIPNHFDEQPIRDPFSNRVRSTPIVYDSD
ncbi:hypothetical protein BC833DRAFT_661296 [Globomyces pollinis-pini]|nr:hypothetical protein BC833DRAFT_661296 [Globomyces pollinis-pini]